MSNAIETPDVELLPWPKKLPNAALEYGQMPSAAEFESRVLATFHRFEVKPAWLSHGDYKMAWAAGVTYRNGPFTPIPVSAARLAVIIENLVTMSYIGTEWGMGCRKMAISLMAELGIIWPNE